MRSRSRSAPSWILALVTFLPQLASRPARADRELIVPFHEAGHVVVDDLAGLRVSAAGVANDGPLGFSHRRESVADLGQRGGEVETTAFWAAPSLDVFVAEHLTLGAFASIVHASSVVRAREVSVDLPSSTSFTVLPRLGLFTPFGDRHGLWVRAGVGYAQAEGVAFTPGGTPVETSFRAALVALDLALVYRFTEVFFARVGPRLQATLGGQQRDGSTLNTPSTAAAASILELSASCAFGANLDP